MNVRSRLVGGRHRAPIHPFIARNPAGAPTPDTTESLGLGLGVGDGEALGVVLTDGLGVDGAPALGPKSGHAGDGLGVSDGDAEAEDELGVGLGDTDAELALVAVEAPQVSEDAAKETGANTADDRSEASGSVNSPIRQGC